MLDRRRRWHPICVATYNATDPRALRQRVRRRDRGVCALCRVDTLQLRRGFKGRGMWARMRKQGFVPRRSLWELDHKIPLIDGGTHELSNLQTLCVPCHRKKSAREHSERAVQTRKRGGEAAASAASGQVDACHTGDASERQAPIARRSSLPSRSGGHQ